MPKVMYSIKATNQFKKDVKRCRKRGYDLSLLEQVVDFLQKTVIPKTTLDHTVGYSHFDSNNNLLTS